MMRCIVLLPIALIAAPLTAQTVAAASSVNAVSTSEDLAKRMTVPVTINGQGPFDFVIDTGADRTVISKELAERLGLVQDGTAKLHAMGGSSQVDIVKIDRVQVSTNVATNVRAAALPARYVGADGLLGIDSLKGQRIEMDFVAQTMKIVPSEVPEAAPTRDGEVIVVTARSRLGQLVMVDADANGEKIWVVVDTGAQNTVGNPKLRAVLAKRVQGTEVKPIDMIDVLGQRTPADYTIVDRVRIGGVAMGNTAIAFADAHPFKIFDLRKKPSMLLGIETLKAFKKVSVDFSTRKIKFLLPPPGTVMPASGS
jgi:predicted aspartyl protease